MQRRAEGVAGDLKPEWAARPERSHPWLMRLAVRAAFLLGRRPSRVVLVFVCLWFLLFSPSDRSASRLYLRKALGREPRLGDLWRHFHAFGAVILDRMYLLAGQFGRFDVRVHGEEIVAALRDAHSGGLLLGAHLGSFEIVRFLGREKCEMPVRLVMYKEHARNLNSVLDAVDPSSAMPVIPLGTVDSMLQVAEALGQGEFVGILADRNIEGEGTAPCTFFGAPAPLPLGPFRLAAMLRQPLVLMVGLYRGGNRYDIHFERLDDPSADSGQGLRKAGRGRDEVVRQAMQKYAARLEHYCRIAPYNWFNFYDYWS
ncbi:MAG TPA: acyl-CoA synthetase [Burkholderiales bacterium]|nr:acyl-CoA synthetase [Burkholderiales bacterium]